jgi:hypothetical protein
MTPKERAQLKKVGVGDDAEGITILDSGQMVWVGANGKKSLIDEAVHLITFSTNSFLTLDEWTFSRLKFRKVNHYVYLNDMSFCGDSYTFAGVGTATKESALIMLERVLLYGLERLPNTITIHSQYFTDPSDVLTIYKRLPHYAEAPGEFASELATCRVTVE